MKKKQRRPWQKLTKLKTGSLKINKIDKPLAKLIKKKRRRIKSTNLEMKMEKSQQTTQIQRIIRDYYQQLHDN